MRSYAQLDLIWDPTGSVTESPGVTFHEKCHFREIDPDARQRVFGRGENEHKEVIQMLITKSRVASSQH